jgi:prenyltransferase beta subunit
LLDGTVPRDVPPDLAVLQNPDGGFPYDLQTGRPSSLNHTSLVLQWLRDLQLGESEPANGAYAFILSRQTRRGIWREDPEIRAFDPPLWMDAESAAGDVYTTALCAGALLDHPNAAVGVDRALAWLQTQQGRDGLLEGFKLHASWLAVPSFAELLGLEARATRRLVAGLGEALSDEWTPAMLASMLRCLLDAGYTLRTEVVSRAWLRLQALQQPDGSFAPEDEGESAVSVTLTALGVAHRLANERTPTGG